jgi:hypothetical protein
MVVLTPIIGGALRFLLIIVETISLWKALAGQTGNNYKAKTSEERASFT